MSNYPTGLYSYKVYPDFYGGNGNGGAVHRMALEAEQDEAPPSLFLAFFSPAAHFPVPSRQSASQAADAMPTSLLASMPQTPGGYECHISASTDPRRCVFRRCQGVFCRTGRQDRCSGICCGKMEKVNMSVPDAVGWQR